MNNLPEIMVGTVYEVGSNSNISDSLRGMCSVSRILDDNYFCIKRISGMPGLLYCDKNYDDYRIQFKSLFHHSMKIIQLPTNTEVEIKFSFDELLGE